jgi:hypothetical protein
MPKIPESIEKDFPLSRPLPLWNVTMPLWMGGFLFIYQFITHPTITGRFFATSVYPNIGYTGPVAFVSASLLLILASISLYLHSAVRTRFASESSPLKKVLCLLTLALASALSLAGIFILILGPAALSMMDTGLWQSR